MQLLKFGKDESEYLKFDYMNITTNYGKYSTNLYYIVNKNCRDKNDIKKIIFNKDKNCFKISDIKRELLKIGYYLCLQKRLVNNINYYYIIKNNTRSKNLYINDDTTDDTTDGAIYVNIDNVNIDNVNANKLDLSDLD